ncbi:unnamed protein product [Didymodactylos carnosus]|uniref:Uncharacterized protein n=1 Tax=Didymodactylos carnosus TaxID=1234261 RepID=A0A814DVL2_9BILA|nr:unnamed protein product [Didymodactylos carnosus]CAF3735365.1 unnamed protein product [Didymodactylos carnosus]
MPNPQGCRRRRFDLRHQEMFLQRLKEQELSTAKTGIRYGRSRLVAKEHSIPALEESLILELFKAKTIEEAKQLIRDGHFQEKKREYERGIDANFQT